MRPGRDRDGDRPGPTPTSSSWAPSRHTLTTHDVTLRVMASRSLNVADVAFVRTMQKRVGAALRQMREKGRVRSERLGGGKAGWWLAD